MRCALPLLASLALLAAACAGQQLRPPEPAHSREQTGADTTLHIAYQSNECGAVEPCG